MMNRVTLTLTQLFLGMALIVALLWGSAASSSVAQPAADTDGVGTILAFWLTDPLQPLPDGYLPCDGSIVSDAASPLLGQTLPDLRGRFLRGSTVANAGSMGGSASHAHAVQDHVHQGNLSIFGSASHSHSWATWNTSTDNWTFPSGPATTWTNGLDSVGTGDFPIMRAGADPTETYHTDDHGGHSHTIGPVTTNSSSPATDSLEETEHLPQFLDVLYLMKVR